MYLHTTLTVDQNQEPFRPTWLYIKQHNQTGLKYFGKTIRKDPLNYRGSGTYWKNHISKHGNDVSTIWCKLFTNKDDLVEFALKFSQDNNIVESKDWANLKPEDGLDGGSHIPRSEDTKRILSEGKLGSKNPMFGKVSPFRGKTHSDEVRKIIKERRALRTFSEETRQKFKNVVRSEKFKSNLSKLHTGKTLSEETKQKMRKPKSEKAKENMRIAALNREAKKRSPSN